MKIVNSCGSTIYVYGRPIYNDEEYSIEQHVFDTIQINSDIGSCEITCEYSDIFIKNYGSIEAVVIGKKGNYIDVCIRVCNKFATKQSGPKHGSANKVTAKRINKILRSWDV